MNKNNSHTVKESRYDRIKKKAEKTIFKEEKKRNVRVKSVKVKKKVRTNEKKERIPDIILPDLYYK